MQAEIKMKWISVQNDLPKDGDQVLALVSAYFAEVGDPFFQKRTLRIFQATFNRCRGWHIPFLPEYSSAVEYWMKIPEEPQSEECNNGMD